ncbi:hypothetical protein HPB49_025597 [Dermacentor silvarum]|uniref:Uncharacterized protein n=1 Tax=Dermacentor silvarum TaxID=543639 RepID=A0ACB8E4G9_DERSI|nr:hypothetical protein HPB49_025597 [Dermacentor silvarum]
MQCIKDDIERWGHGKQVMLLGDFNAHTQELDGYTDHNGTLVQSLSDELCLCIVNLRGDCVGAVTWCARGSRTCIDYALVSQGLNSSLRSVHIDEDERYSIGSNHNRITLVFTASTWRKTKRETRDPAKRFLPAVAYEAVTDEFENSSHREETITYGQYVAELGLIIRKHERCVNSRSGRPRDGEVQAALEARRIANRQHRRIAKLSDDAACQAAWENYLQAKHKMQTVTQRKIAEAKRSTLLALRKEGKSTGPKFWAYVSSLDSRLTERTLRDPVTDRKADDLHRLLSGHLEQLYGTPLTLQAASCTPIPSSGAKTAPDHVEWKVSRLAVDKAIGRISARHPRP